MATDAASIQEIRDRLPPMKSWTYTHDGAAMAITVAYGHCWPDILVIVGQSGTGLRATGLFGEDGRCRQFTVETSTDEADITSAVLRRPVLGTLRGWHEVGREVGRQLLAGVPEENIVIDGHDATAAMRILMYDASRARVPQRHRGARREDLIREVARAYKVAVEVGDPAPRKTLADAFGLSRAHIGRLLVAARRERDGRPPLLGPARRGRAGETRPLGRDQGRHAPLRHLSSRG